MHVVELRPAVRGEGGPTRTSAIVLEGNAAAAFWRGAGFDLHPAATRYTRCLDQDTSARDTPEVDMPGV